MSEPSKDELVEEAEVSTPSASGKTKPQREDAIAATEPPATPELGPVVPEDGSPPAFESVGSQTGVQPLEPGDIPE